MKTLRLILVHGTYKPNAAWSLEMSPLTDALRRTFDSAEIERFVWDGENSVRSRHTAAQSLAIKLDELRAAEPNKLVVVIAHSHGGNIAFNAIASLPTHNNVGALVTLGTPFFEFLPRETGNATVYAMSLSLGTSVLAGIALSFLNLPAAAVTLTSLVLFVGLTLVLRKKLHRYESESAAWLNQFRHGHGASDLPILCIRFGLDEARLWLLSLNFIRKLDKFIAKHARAYLSLTKEKIGVAAIALAFIVFGLVKPEDSIAPLFSYAVSLFVSVVAICILLLAIASPLAVLASFIATHRFGFGGQPGFRALQFDLKVDVVPPSGNLYRERFSSTLALIRGLWAPKISYATPHALGYTDKKSIGFLCRWIENMLSIYRRHDA